MTNRARVFCEKAEDLLPRLPADSFDSIVTDPPYALEFMGKAWDSFGRDTGNGYQEKPRIVDAVPGTRRAGPNHYEAGHPFQRWCETWAAEAFRVLKPGGYLVAFGGTRTYHRLACAIEDAGFEIRDSLHWLYGSGFSKGLNVSKAIDKAAGAQREVIGSKTAGQSSLQRVSRVEQGYRENLTACTPEDIPVTAPATEDAARWQGWNTTLKPAHEPIILARKPLSEGTVAANVLRWGTGALNVDGCRVGMPVDPDPRGASRPRGTFPHSDDAWGNGRSDEVSVNHEAGRWPPNLLLTHSADCQPAGTRQVKVVGATAHQAHHAVEGIAHGATPHEHPGYRDPDGTETVQAWDCVPGCPVAGLDAQSGTLTSGANPSRRGSDKFRNAYGDFTGQRECTPQRGVDTGGASRFFPQFTWSPEYDLPYFYCAKAPKKERPRIVTDDGRVIQHPTVKPLALMRWLVRLVTSPGGTVGDFFTGTGPVVQAALDEGMRCVACDQDPDSVALSRVRLAPYAGVRFTVPDPAVPEPAGQPDSEAECG